MNSLENVLLDLQEQEEEQIQQVFAVLDLESAAEAQRRIAYFEEKKNEIDSIIEKQIAPFLLKIEKIKEWGEQAKIEFNEKQVHYSNHLEMYLREEVAKQLASGKKPKKTIKLPYGNISLKAQQPEFKRDDKELLPYARSNGFAKLNWSVDWAELKKTCQVVDGKVVDENGEIVPGVTAVERDEKFEIKLNK